MLVKIVFPPTFSIASKTFSFEDGLPVGRAVSQVKEQVKSQFPASQKSSSEWGLYIPEKKLWLDNLTSLSEYSSLLDQAVIVEFRDRISGEEQPDYQLWQGVALGAAATILAVGVWYYVRSRN